MENMNLDKFVKKMKKESLIKSIICGISAGILLDTLIIILFKVTGIKVVVWLHCILCGTFSGLFEALFNKYVFTFDEKQIAKKIEGSIQLNERVKTMVEFKDDSSLMAHLQREDTKSILNNTDTKAIKPHFSFSNFILSICACASLVIAIFVEAKEIDPNASTPQTSDSSSSSEEESSSPEESSSSNEESNSDSQSDSGGSEQENPSISDAIDDMKQDVDENEGLDQNGKEEIKDKLDDLKDKLENDKTPEEQEKDIEDSKQDIDKTLDDKISKDEIGEALKNQDTTTNLGDPIIEGNIDNTNSALDEMRDSLKDLTGESLKNALENMANDIDNALNASGVSEDDPLYQAFKNFSTNLKDDAQHVNDADIQIQIDQTFEQAKDEINDALNAQNSIGDLKDKLDQKLDDLKSQLGEGKGDEPSPDDPDDKNNNGEDHPSGPGTMGDGDLKYASDDMVYDPVQNKYVTYGELITDYYEKVIGGTSGDEIPEEIKQMIFEYFSSLYSEQKEN